MTHKNLNAYNGYELFYDYDEIKKYRQSKLDGSEKNLKFIKFFFKEKINILELGSGNSKLLYNLNSKNMLNFGYGFEISNDRFNFAENWKKDLKINNVKNICDNFYHFQEQVFQQLHQLEVEDLQVLQHLILHLILEDQVAEVVVIALQEEQQDQEIHHQYHHHKEIQEEMEMELKMDLN